MTKQQLKEEAQKDFDFAFHSTPNLKLDLSVYLVESKIDKTHRQLIKDFINSQIDKAYEEGKKTERESIIKDLKNTNDNAWGDADHCSCLGYAISKLINPRQ